MNSGCDEIPGNAMLQPTALSIKSLSSVEQHYSNIKCRALGILCGLEKIHHYYFMREVSVITNDKPLVAIPSKHVATLSQRLKRIMLQIHQYRGHITISLAEICTSQPGYPATTTQKTETRKLQE